MKCILGVVVACLLLLLEAGCLSETRKPSTSPAGAVAASGRMTFARTEHDYGMTAPGSVRKCEFAFTNTGRDDLHVYKVEGCCGMITRMDKQVYASGEAGTLEVEYYAKTTPGFFKRAVYIYSSDPDNPKARLTVEGMVAAAVAFEPNELILDPRRKTVPDLVLHSIDKKPFAVEQIAASLRGIRLDPGRTGAADRYVVRVLVDWDQLEQGTAGYMTVKTTHPDCDSVNIPVQVLSAYQANPSFLSLFNVGVGRPIPRSIWVLNNYGEPFAIDSVRSDEGCVRPVSSTPIANGYQLALNVVAPPAAGQRSFKDTISIAIRNGPVLRVECYGVYQEDSPSKP